jgi:hypothetical protein
LRPPLLLVPSLLLMPLPLMPLPLVPLLPLVGVASPTIT